MKMIVDASAVLAVAFDEPERSAIIEATTGATLMALARIGAMPMSRQVQELRVADCHTPLVAPLSYGYQAALQSD